LARLGRPWFPAGNGPVIRPHAGRRLERIDAPGGDVEVREDGEYRWLLYGSSAVQSAMKLGAPHTLVLRYMHQLMACLLFREASRSLLLLGLGGGDLVRFFSHHWPAAQLTAVEQNKAIVRVARRYFQLPALSDRFRVYIADALEFVERGKTGYDLLICDLFADARMPAFLDSDAFFIDCHRLLDRQGMLAMNLLVEDEQHFLSVMSRLRRCFDRRTLCLPVAGCRNIVVFAFKQSPAELSRAVLTARASVLEPAYGLRLQGMVNALFATNPSDGVSLRF
jgi:spermidine synthase